MHNIVWDKGFFYRMPHFMEVVRPFFRRHISFVTVSSSSATWTATFCLGIDLVCAVLVCVQTVACLPTLGIFNVCSDVKTCDCTL